VNDVVDEGSVLIAVVDEVRDGRKQGRRSERIEKVRGVDGVTLGTVSWGRDGRRCADLHMWLQR
jgi:hypothetical protein